MIDCIVYYNSFKDSVYFRGGSGNFQWGGGRKHSLRRKAVAPGHPPTVSSAIISGHAPVSAKTRGRVPGASVYFRGGSRNFQWGGGCKHFLRRKVAAPGHPPTVSSAIISGRAPVSAKTRGRAGGICIFQGRIQKFSMGRGMQTFFKKKSGGPWAPTYSQTPCLCNDKRACPCFCKNKGVHAGGTCIFQGWIQEFSVAKRQQQKQNTCSLSKNGSKTSRKFVKLCFTLTCLMGFCIAFLAGFAYLS